jgi:hypothetical protein
VSIWKYDVACMDSHKPVYWQTTYSLKDWNQHMDTINVDTQQDDSTINGDQSCSPSLWMILISDISANNMSTIYSLPPSNNTTYFPRLGQPIILGHHDQMGLSNLHHRSLNAKLQCIVPTHISTPNTTTSTTCTPITEMNRYTAPKHS